MDSEQKIQQLPEQHRIYFIATCGLNKCTFKSDDRNESCLSILSYCCYEIANKSNVRKEGFSLACSSGVQSTVIGRSRPQEFEAAAHMTSTRRKPWMRKVKCASILYSSRAPPRERCHLQWVCLPTLINFIKIFPRRRLRRTLYRYRWFYISSRWQLRLTVTLCK